MLKLSDCYEAFHDFPKVFVIKLSFVFELFINPKRYNILLTY